jgi:N-acetylneuraminic acid mutarotase
MFLDSRKLGRARSSIECNGMHFSAQACQETLTCLLASLKSLVKEPLQKPLLARRHYIVTGIDMGKTAAILLVLVFLMSLLTVQVKSASAVTEDSWEVMAPIPTARSQLGVAVVNGKIYAIGGTSGTQTILGTNEVYDPETNAWSSKTPMPTPRYSFGIAVYQNKIYCIGGETFVKNEGYVTDINEVYDPATDTWENRTSMITPRARLEANAVGGEIFLIGGISRVDPRMFLFTNTTSLNEVYSPEADSWTAKASMPNASANYVSAVLDDRIYVMGGESNEARSLNQVYAVKTDSWSYAAPVPENIWLNVAAAAATTGVNAFKQIYVIGGYYGLTDTSKPYDFTSQLYNPMTDSWSFATYMPVEDHHFSVAVVDDMLYVVGGSSLNNTVPYAYNLRYTPIGYGTPDTSTPFPSSKPQLTEPFPTVLVVAASVGIIAAVAGLLVYFKKRHKLKSA